MIFILSTLNHLAEYATLCSSKTHPPLSHPSLFLSPYIDPPTTSPSPTHQPPSLSQLPHLRIPFSSSLLPPHNPLPHHTTPPRHAQPTLTHTIYEAAGVLYVSNRVGSLYSYPTFTKRTLWFVNCPSSHALTSKGAPFHSLKVVLLNRW